MNLNLIGLRQIGMKAEVQLALIAPLRFRGGRRFNIGLCMGNEINPKFMFKFAIKFLDYRN